MNNLFKIIILAAVIAVIATTGYFILRPTATPQPVSCTLEAKVCPDGSNVGRTGPNCEFVQCPAATTIPGWKAFSDAQTGVSFQYPENFSTKYISIVDWPPLASAINEPFTCTEAGSEIGRAGITQKQTIDGREYCVTKISEGAAGSVYTQYAYAFPLNGKTEVLTFSLRFPQCANYPDPQKTACVAERAPFDPGATIDRIAQTLKIK